MFRVISNCKDARYSRCKVKDNIKDVCIQLFKSVLICTKSLQLLA